MPSEEGRRKKDRIKYEILLVPQGEGGTKRSFLATRFRLWMLVTTTIGFMLTLVVLLLVYTPIAMYIPIKNPELEQRYGRQILETQERLNTLAQDVLVLRDYNQQLRKALGEFGGKDTGTAKSLPLKAQSPSAEPVPIVDSGYLAIQEDIPGGPDDDYDLNAGPYRSVTTAVEGGRPGLPLLSPTDGLITQGFDPLRGHFGIDYAVKRGTAVYAATDGHVVFSGWTFDDGNMIILSHGGGYLTLYKHNQLLFKSQHAFARRGELIAESGSTGQTSFGPHLHFEVWANGVPQDPGEYLLSTPKIQ